MQGHGPIVAGVVKSNDNLIIIDEHRVQEGLDQPPLTVDVGVIHVGELVQEEQDVLANNTLAFPRLATYNGGKGA